VVAAAGDRQPDATLLIGAVTRRRGASRVNVPIILRTARPVYGIAFMLKYSADQSAVRYVSTETAESVLGEALMLSNALDKEGIAQVGMTQTRGTGFNGSGQLATISLDLADQNAGAVCLEIVEIRANDADGNPLVVAGSSYKGVLTSAQNEVQRPTQYRLTQNYPNPFNPTTTISFSVPEESRVKLAVFDMLGREIKSLTEDVRSAGTYNVLWDGKNAEGLVMESGVYFYRMTATTGSGKMTTETQRMILMK
jgi:hypothetical protein